MIAAAVSVATAMADSAATATAAIGVTVVRGVRAMTTQRSRSKNHGRSWCTPSVFPPPQDLPVHGSECAEDRFQGFEAVDALRFRARQDRAEPHHRRLRQEAARTRARHQALAFPRPLAVRDTLGKSGRRLLVAGRKVHKASGSSGRRWLGFSKPLTARKERDS